MTLELHQLRNGDNAGRLAAEELETILETYWPQIGDEPGEFGGGNWRQHWSLTDWGMEMTLEI